jgi:hypothetical protein
LPVVRPLRFPTSRTPMPPSSLCDAGTPGGYRKCVPFNSDLPRQRGTTG